MSVDFIIIWLCSEEEKNNLPKTIVNKITKPSQIKNASCQWGIENEQKALVKYHEYKDEINEHVALCSACGLVVMQSNVAMAWS
jgi:hypothetical protein